jgi:phenylalanyl-tRNA synthetase beta chain
VDGQTVATWGEIHPEVAQSLDLRGRVLVAEVCLPALMERANFQRSALPLPRFPSIQRDLALVVARDIEAGPIRQAITETAGDLLTEVELFDFYEGGQLGEGQKSLGFTLSFRAPERTLRDEEVDEIQGAVVARLTQEFGATLRTQ